jgi:hypothetical protein
MNDLDRITDILYNYYKCRQISPDEEELLCDWLNESQANEHFLTELSDDASWIKNSAACGIRDLIRERLMLLHKK